MKQRRKHDTVDIETLVLRQIVSLSNWTDLFRERPELFPEETVVTVQSQAYEWTFSFNCQLEEYGPGE